MSEDRYARQTVFSPIGKQGQAKLATGHVAVVGCGALGTSIAVILVRMGVGRVTLVDRDYVALSNLPRQALFTEEDVRLRVPKAIAAERALLAINSAVTVEGRVANLSHASINSVVGRPDVILDGMDNFETRMLVNDYAVAEDIPWIYGAVLGASGLCMNVLPRETPCLRCLFEEPPDPGKVETTETAGVIAPVIRVIAAVEATEAVKLLIGKRAEMCGGLFSVDLWDGQFRRMDTSRLREGTDCPSCKQGDFPWLEGRRNADRAFRSARTVVQIDPAESGAVDLAELARTLSDRGRVELNEFLVTFETASVRMTVFADGRAIVEGIASPEEACAVYEKLVGRRP